MRSHDLLIADLEAMTCHLHGYTVKTFNLLSKNVRREQQTTLLLNGQCIMRNHALRGEADMPTYTHHYPHAIQGIHRRHVQGPWRLQTDVQTQRSIGVMRGEFLAHDNIWALDGADIPFVLRKVDHHNVLVGECFLYRALRHSLCICCGRELDAWPVVTHIIDIW